MIRAARPTDAEAIAGLWNEMIAETTDTFTTVPKTVAGISALIAERPVIVAEQEGRFAGFATFGPFRSGPGYAQTVEHTILVTPQARGAGVAQILMTNLEDEARRAGHHVMVAGISASNRRAIRFHAGLGFAEVARMPEVGEKWGQKLDLVLMQKIL